MICGKKLVFYFGEIIIQIWHIFDDVGEKTSGSQIHFEILSPLQPQICEIMMSLMSPEQISCYKTQNWGQLINFGKCLQVLGKYEKYELYRVIQYK